MVYRYGRSYNYLLFSYHLICIGVLLFYNGKDSLCLPEISFAQLGQRWRMPLYGRTVIWCIQVNVDQLDVGVT